MVPAKAEYLASRYTVDATQNDSLTGAYAVLFRDTANGERTLAVRGTEGATDVVADAHLLVGIPARTGITGPWDHGQAIAGARLDHCASKRRWTLFRRTLGGRTQVLLPWNSANAYTPTPPAKRH